MSGPDANNTTGQQAQERDLQPWSAPERSATVQQPLAVQQSPSTAESLPEKTVLVRYGRMRLLGQFTHNLEQLPKLGGKVVIRTDRGIELGEIVCPCCHSCGDLTIPAEKIDNYIRASGENYPFTRKGKFLRLATPEDLNEAHHLQAGEVEEAIFCKKLIAKHKLPMKLVDVEHLFGGDRIIFYFMAEGRVDFRELVKDLAREYQTRIEMRQVGARDEARLLADYETCGQQVCCKEFLKILQPVSMRMAKMQKATLDPSKISGRCGRLKCCLRYENQTYQELRDKLPRKGTKVRTEQGEGVVIDGRILTQLVQVELSDGRRIVVANEELTVIDEQAGTVSASSSRQSEHANAQQQSGEQTLPHLSQALAEGPADAESTASEDTDAETGEEQPISRTQNPSSSSGRSKRSGGRRRRRRRKKTGRAS